MYHKDLEIYKKSMDLVMIIYEITKDFPNNESFGLISQLRRSAVSIPSNIAEGCARGSDKQIYHFVNIALGSLAELETQLEISKRLGYIKDFSYIDQSFQSLKSLLLGFKKHIINKSEL